MGFLHMVVRNQNDVRGLGSLGQKPASLVQIAGADLDIIASLGKMYADGFAFIVHVALLNRYRSAVVTVILRIKPAWRWMYSNSVALAGSA